MEKKEKDEKTEITKNDIEVIQKIKEVQKQTEEQTAAMKKAFSDILNDILNIDVPTFLDKYGMLPSAMNTTTKSSTVFIRLAFGPVMFVLLIASNTNGIPTPIRTINTMTSPIHPDTRPCPLLFSPRNFDFPMSIRLRTGYIKVLV